MPVVLDAVGRLDHFRGDGKLPCGHRPEGGTVLEERGTRRQVLRCGTCGGVFGRCVRPTPPRTRFWQHYPKCRRREMVILLPSLLA